MSRRTIVGIEVEGNKGGSYVRLESHPDKPGFCYLQVGHDCVSRVPFQAIEVTKLAQIISDALNP